MQRITLNEVDILDYRKGSGDTIEIYDIVVNSERGVGRGKLLFEELLRRENPKRVFAFCRAENDNAHKYYRKLGCREVDLGQFYPDGKAKLFIYETN